MPKLLFLCLMTICHFVFALPEDREKRMELSADSADITQIAHHGEYIGHVELDQGSTHLRAAKAITEGDKRNKLVLAVAEGNKKEQAHCWTLTAVDKPPLHAYADIIRYLPEQHTIELIGNAKVIQGDNSFSAHKIIYDTVKQHVISKSDGKTRTTIIFHPEKKQ